MSTGVGAGLSKSAAPTAAPERSRPATVLVVGTDDWAVQQSSGVLAAAGHRVLGCHEPGEAAFPCNAFIEGRTCPLEVGFDVVLTVRAAPRSAPAPGEMGVVCALHAGVPLVAAGMLGKNPFAPWAARVVGAKGDLTEVCQDAAAISLVDLTETKA